MKVHSDNRLSALGFDKQKSKAFTAEKADEADNRAASAA